MKKLFLPVLTAGTLLGGTFGASSAFAQFVFLEDIDVAMQNAKNVVITLNGKKPSPCFVIDSSTSVEDTMVTVSLEVKFPEGTTVCNRAITPFEVSSQIDRLPQGDYEVQVTINGEMQVDYRNFTVMDQAVSII